MSAKEYLKNRQKRASRGVSGEKTDLDQISSPYELQQALRDHNWEPRLKIESYEAIMNAGFRSKNLLLASVAAEICCREQPLTLRHVMYLLVPRWLPSTDKAHYKRTGNIMTTLREREVLPFSWIVDNVRSTIKPSSWAGLADFAETVQGSYRKDFWANLPSYVHIIVEKDAVAGTLAPVTRKYDVALSPIRGYASLSFAHEIASTWGKITKPIHAYYLGDFDPSGLDLERDIKDKLGRYCKRPFKWTRLGVNAADFADFNLIPLKPKKKDGRYADFVRRHGTRCAELDAIPPTELRRRVEAAILAHIPATDWERLQQIEKLEKEHFNKVLANFKAGV